MNPGDETTSEGNLPIHAEPAPQHVRPRRSGEGMASVLAHLHDHLFRKSRIAVPHDPPEAGD